jgi:hypothetical protein
MRTILFGLAAGVALGGAAATQDQSARTSQKTTDATGDLWITPITRLQQDLGIPVGERMKLSGVLVTGFAAGPRSEFASGFRTEAPIAPIPHYDISPPPSINDSTSHRANLAILRLSW